jgi:hypothetical protein
LTSLRGEFLLKVQEMTVQMAILQVESCMEQNRPRAPAGAAAAAPTLPSSPLLCEGRNSTQQHQPRREPAHAA